MGLGLLGDVASVAAIGLTGHRVPDVADQDQRRCGGERVEKGRSRIRDDQHVAFLDLLETTDRRAVESDAFVERICIHRAGRDGEMLPDTRKVGEPQIDHLDLLVLDRFQEISGRRTIRNHGFTPVTGMGA
jgi:hypothetical protein